MFKKIVAYALVLCMALTMSSVATFATTPEVTPDQLDDYSLSVKLSHDPSEITSITSKYREGDAEFELIKDKDYTVEDDNTIIIKYSYLKGDKRKSSYDWRDTLYINYGEDDYNYVEVPNYNIETYGSAKLSSYVYNGKNSKVEGAGLNGKKGAYKIHYLKKNRKAIGTYKIEVKAIAPYVGTVTKSYKVIPKTPTKVAVKRKATKSTVTWKKVKNCTGYKIQFCKELPDEGDSISYDVKKTVYVKDKSKTSKVVKIKKSKYNFIKIRAYKVVNGKKIYSKTKYKWVK